MGSGGIPTQQDKPADLCFICMKLLEDGRELTTAGLGFVVHKECEEEPDDD